MLEDSVQLPHITSTFGVRGEDVQGMSRRKLSHPVSLDGSARTELPSYNTRRRFSQVSDAVSRKFSHTLGWSHSTTRHILAAEVLSQARSLCGQYVRARLRRSAGPAAKKLGLQRMRSTASLPLAVREVLPALLALGREMERLQPKVYSGVVRQTCHVVSEKGVSVVLPAVSRRLMRPGVSWPKVISLYEVAGGLALDCVTQGHPEYLHLIVDSMAQALENDVALWIADNGGWSGILSLCKPEVSDMSFGGYITAIGFLVAVMILIAVGFKWYGKYSHL